MTLECHISRTRKLFLLHPCNYLVTTWYSESRMACLLPSVGDLMSKKKKFVKFLDKGGVYNKICSVTYEGSALSAIHYLALWILEGAMHSSSVYSFSFKSLQISLMIVWFAGAVALQYMLGLYPLFGSKLTPNLWNEESINAGFTLHMVLCTL